MMDESGTSFYNVHQNKLLFTDLQIAAEPDWIVAVQAFSAAWIHPALAGPSVAVVAGRPLVAGYQSAAVGWRRQLRLLDPGSQVDHQTHHNLVQGAVHAACPGEIKIISDQNPMT